MKTNVFSNLFSPQYFLSLTAFCVWHTGPQHDLYDLTGVVHHIGRSTRKGHYITFARLPDGRWRRYDDSNVTAVKEQNVLTKDALILSYTRRPGQAR